MNLFTCAQAKYAARACRVLSLLFKVMRFSAKRPPFKVISGFSLLPHWHWLGSSYSQPQRFHIRQKKMRMAGLIRLLTSKLLALCRPEKYPHTRAGAPVKIMSAVSLSLSTDMRPSRNQWSLVTSLLQFELETPPLSGASIAFWTQRHSKKNYYKRWGSFLQSTHHRAELPRSHHFQQWETGVSRNVGQWVYSSAITESWVAEYVLVVSSTKNAYGN